MLQCYNTPVAALCRTYPPGSQERLCMVWSARWSEVHYLWLENHWASVLTPIWTPPSNLVKLLTGMSEHPHVGRFRKLWRPAGSLLPYAGVHDYDPVSTCNDVILYFLIRIINTKTSPYDVFIKYKANDFLFKAVSCKRSVLISFGAPSCFQESASSD